MWGKYKPRRGSRKEWVGGWVGGREVFGWLGEPAVRGTTTGFEKPSKNPLGKRS